MILSPQTRDAEGLMVQRSEGVIERGIRRGETEGELWMETERVSVVRSTIGRIKAILLYRFWSMAAPVPKCTRHHSRSQAKP